MCVIEICSKSPKCYWKEECKMNERVSMGSSAFECNESELKTILLLKLDDNIRDVNSFIQTIHYIYSLAIKNGASSRLYWKRTGSQVYFTLNLGSIAIHSEILKRGGEEIGQRDWTVWKVKMAQRRSRSKRWYSPAPRVQWLRVCLFTRLPASNKLKNESKFK